MSAPTIQVLVGFQSTTGFGTPFLLDDAYWGVLDTAGRGTLGGVVFVDLTNLVESVNITRGRSRQLDQFNAGTATIAFDNVTQVLNPKNTSSPYYPFVLPRCPVQILANGTPIYTGLVTDWNLDYDISNQDKMYATCADNFTVLANQSLNAYTPPPQNSGQRIDSVLSLSEINYQGGRLIDTGASVLGAFAVAQDTNCLNYLQQVNTSEQGYLFMAADGTLTFKSRTSVLNPVIGATFNTDGTGVPYQTLINQYGDELLYNYIVTKSDAGAKQITSNAESIALYQTQQYALMELLNESLTEVADLGNYLLGRYQNPILRFTGLSVQMAAISLANQNIILGLDMTDVCTVVKNFVVGSPATETQTLIISGISHSITPASHIVSYTFESTDGNQNALTLDDPIFGTLDNNLLSF
jgi:hypothetical protein